ncbi:MAG: HsdR family type I site-specific deoxyribonuclease [Bacteroidales bacterium]|jgi:type I restriction enzyme R subunit|nr:HsdR family type I site-specific deoxyribonuclease [Bacteroidales bacterium]
MSEFQVNEKGISQVPALQVLINLGYEYLSPTDALWERQDNPSNVILENILRNQLKKINRIQHKGEEYLFSEENIQSAILQLKNIQYDGLLKTNEAVYDLLTLGTALEQTAGMDTRSFTLNYIDWENPERNVYHVSPEFSVERTRSVETARPDLVLFVNGIPLAVIECKSPQTDLEQAVSQSIRNQKDEYIPKLFIYSQLLLATNKNAAKYATAGTAAKFWGVWREYKATESEERRIEEIVSRPLNEDDRQQLVDFVGYGYPRDGKDRLVTEQDRALYNLCRPERLLELVYKFTLFDNGQKKLARYQQYFVVKSILRRIREIDAEGRRKGGMVWHTQGSGKSLTMVMLARNLALDQHVKNPRIVLVTDRENLDKQLGNTFHACGMEKERATSGRHLAELVNEKKAGIITTLVHKFDKALNYKRFQDESSDIFVLVDESHRTQFGSFSARMRQMFPKACYLGFTGTPLMKEEKNNFARFGGLVSPHYPISQAVKDKAVVPLLYEGRHVEMVQNKAAIDLWFDRHTNGLSQEQQADLKKKYSRAEMLNKADQVIFMRAFDISEHFRANWQGTGFKGQLVAPGKVAALKYNEYLDEIGYVSSAVLISPPDLREGFDDVDDESKNEVNKFWHKMMKRYGTEEFYNSELISRFKFGDEPEIIIVVDKLLTGFDAPRNVVMYLCRTLREHTLLQAIARVNRLYEGKEFGYIVDYASVLGELDQALNMYSALEDFDEEDIEGTLTSINSEIAKLPQKHALLWDVFKTVRNREDEEEYERLLSDQIIREDFYKKLADYSKVLAIALSSEVFMMQTDPEKISRYKMDLKRFQALRASVKLRYAESIDYRDYEPRIKKLLDTHLQANEVIQLNEPVDIFDDHSFNCVKENRGVYSHIKTDASKADTIAHATARTITDRMEEDPAFYSKFSKLIQQTIDDFKARRISDLEYLNKVTEIRDKVVGKEHDHIPENLKGLDEAVAYYGVLKEIFSDCGLDENEVNNIAADAAKKIFDILKQRYKVNFWQDEDAQNQAANAIDDYLFDELNAKKNLDLDPEKMDTIIEKTMRIARNRNSG